jgi:hypothetical protein
MKNVIVARVRAHLDRVHHLGPTLIATVALVVTACNNGNGGSGY